MVKRKIDKKKTKTVNKLESYLSKVFANPLSPREDFEVLDNALEKLYNEKADMSENIRDLFEDAVNIKKFEDLKLIISNWIASRVTKETALATIILAEEHNDMNLKVKALNFIQNNIDVLVCKKWEDLHKFKKLKDEIYKSLLISLFQKNKALSDKVCDIETDLEKTEEYEFSIKRVFKEENTSFEEPSTEEPSIEEQSTEEPFIKELPIDEEEMNEDVPSTSSIGLTVSETTEEMSLEYKIPLVRTPDKEIVMKNTGVLNHGDESLFESYMRTQQSLIEPKPPTAKSPFSYIENYSNENLFNSLKTHFVPVKESRVLYIKEIHVNSIEKHAFKKTVDGVDEGDIETEAGIDKIKLLLNMIIERNDSESSPIPKCPKYNMILPISESNSSQSLCSDLTDHLLKTCSHNLVTTCNICIENAEINKQQEKDEKNIIVQKVLPPINTFMNSKTSMRIDRNAVSSWVEQTTYLAEENRNIRQKMDDLEAKMDLAKERWHAIHEDIVLELDNNLDHDDSLEQDMILEQDKNLENDKNLEKVFECTLENAFKELVTLKTGVPRQFPVKLNTRVANNTFQQMKQAAEREFEMRNKDVPIPYSVIIQTVPSSPPKKYTTPIPVVSDSKFFQQNKNIKFFKSNQNKYSTQRRKKPVGQQNICLYYY